VSWIGSTQAERRSSAREVRRDRRVTVELGRIQRWPRPHAGQDRRIRPATRGRHRRLASGDPRGLARNACAREKRARADAPRDGGPRTDARASTKPWRMIQPGSARAGVQRDAAQRSVYYRLQAQSRGHCRNGQRPFQKGDHTDRAILEWHRPPRMLRRCFIMRGR